MNDTSSKSRWLGPLCALILTSGAALAADPIRYSTYLGGSDQDSSRMIGVDAAGNAYVVGTTLSTDFPVVGGLGNGPTEDRYHLLDSFLSKLSPGGDLVYSSYFLSGFHGGRYNEIVEDIVVTPGGGIYFTGWIDYGEDVEAFVGAFGLEGGGGYFTYLLGEELDQAFSITVDSSGNAYVTGVTTSYWFPSEKPNMRVGGLTPFLVKMNPQGRVEDVRLLDRDDISDIPTFLVGGYGPLAAMDATGNVYEVGTTSSADFPITADALQTSLNGPEDIFLIKRDPSGHVVYSTFLGGSGSDRPLALGIDRAGGVYLASWTSSDDSPLLDPNHPGCTSGLVSRLDLRRSLIVRTACVPGGVGGMAVSPDGAAHVINNAEGGIPTVNAFQPFPAGKGDAFVTRLELNPPPVCSAAFASPAALWPPNGKLVPVSIQGVVEPDGDPITLTVTAIRQDEPLTKPGSADATGIGMTGASLRADRDGKGDGRVYRLSFTGSDPQGASCTGEVTVCVPHGQGGGQACGDGGGLFDSTGSGR